MTEDHSLEKMLDDDSFAALIEERLSELKIDPEDPRFIAVWTAADFRLKHLHSLNGKEDVSERIMDSFRSRGFIPQFDICGPPTISIRDITMAPKGDLCYTLKFNPDYSYSLYIFASGNLLPLTMINLGISKNCSPVLSFSYDSRYVAVSTEMITTIWDVFKLTVVSTLGKHHVDNISWSRDSSRIACTRADTIEIIDILTGDIIFECESEGMCKAFLDEHGDQILLLDNDPEIMEIETEEEIPIMLDGISDNPLVHFRDGAFWILDNGRTYRASKEGCQMISDLSMEIDVTNEACKHFIRSNTNNDTLYQPKITTDGNTVLINTWDRHNTIQHCINIDTLQISCTQRQWFPYEISTTKLHSLSDEACRAYTGITTIQNEALHDDSGTFYRIMPDCIVAFRLYKKGPDFNLYQFRKYYAKIPASRQFGYVDPLIMADLDTSMPEPEGIDEYQGEDRSTISLMTDDPAKVKLFEVACPIHTQLDLDFNPKFASYMRKNGWRDVSINGRPVEMMDRNEPALIYDGGKIWELPVPEGTVATADPRYRVCENGLYSLNSDGRSFSKISSEDFYINTLWSIDEKEGFIIMRSEEKDRMRILWKGRTVREFGDNVAADIIDGRLFKVEDSTISVETIDGSKQYLKISASQTDKWMPLGMDSKGTVSLIMSDSEESGSIRFARMTIPDLKLDVFDACRLPRDIDDLLFKVDFRGTRAVSISSEESFVRPIRMTSYLLKKDGLRTGMNLIPDDSKQHSSILPLGGSKYLIASDGKYDDDKKAVKNGIRPVMRLMDAKTGTMVRKERNRTEGQLHGLRDYELSKIALAPGFQQNLRIVAEFVRGTDHEVQTIDGFDRHYPSEDAAVKGLLLDADAEKISVGIMGGNMTAIDSYQEFDADMVPLTERRPLNCRMSIHRKYKCQAIPAGIELSSFSFEGKSYSIAHVTVDNAGIFGNGHSIDSDIPVIIELDSQPVSERTYPMPSSRSDDPTIETKRILLCTLRNGILRNMVPYTIDVATPQFDVYWNYHDLRLSYSDRVYRIRQSVIYHNCDTDGFSRTIEVPIDGEPKILEYQEHISLDLDDLIAASNAPEDREKDTYIDGYKVILFQGILGLLKN